MANKQKYLDALVKLKQFSDDTPDDVVDSVLTELDVIWEQLTDDERDDVNALDDEDF